ncbi:uncharacterized protein LOC131935648 [Physella acuta]|uniref:uncharacterized protein LOC131935648 n=1 Tax=Physella acuta TaxID=109671 RepID=UPI0027DD9A1C|nr:uncharacterized protein LOC131935648 [Physella acuta]
MAMNLLKSTPLLGLLIIVLCTSCFSSPIAFETSTPSDPLITETSTESGNITTATSTQSEPVTTTTAQPTTVKTTTTLSLRLQLDRMRWNSIWNAMCATQPCPLYDWPLCASDGKTYMHECWLNRANCYRGPEDKIRKVHDGVCQN